MKTIDLILTIDKKIDFLRTLQEELEKDEVDEKYFEEIKKMLDNIK